MDNNENSPVAPDEIKEEFAPSDTPETPVSENETTEAPVSEEKAPETPVFESATPEPTATLNEPKPKKSKAPLIAIIIALIIIAGGVVAFFLLKDQLFGTKQKNDSGEDKKPVAEVGKLTMENNALSDFDLSLLKLNNKEENKIYSPLSIKYALRMLSDGANGETKQEIDNILGQYKSKAYLNSKNRSLANALFVQSSRKGQILDSYINGLRTNYAANVIYDDFTSAKNVNKWVSDKTLGIISGIVNDDDVAGLDFALINALAIDMDWTNRIQCAVAPDNSIANKDYSVAYSHEDYSDYVSCILTTDQFETISFNDGKQSAKVAKIGASINNYDIIKELGEKKIRDTVRPKYVEYQKEEGYSPDENYPADPEKYLDKYISEIKANYGQAADSTDFQMYNDDDVRVFAKDLKSYDGSTLQYVGIMPKAQKLADYIKDTDASKLSETLGKLYGIKNENFKAGVVTKIKGSIPFFKYSYDLDLVDNLKELGIKKVFNAKEADLSKLSSAEGTAITTAKHKADIDFSNDGIKAAAVTALGGAGDAHGFDYYFKVPVEEIDMTFDKPYLYIIRDKQTGEIWFTGTVYEPLKTVNAKDIPVEY